MKNREVFKVFRGHIGPVVSALGFAAQQNTGTELPWTRKLDNGRHQTIWRQMDKWPWDIWMGSQFTVNFQDSKKPGLAPSRGAKRARIGDLLKDEHKKEAERIQNLAIRKIKIPSAEEYNKEMGLAFAECDDDFVLDEYRQRSRPARFGSRLGDLWLRVVDAEDLRAWAAFLAAWMPLGLRCFTDLDGEQYSW